MERIASVREALAARGGRPASEVEPRVAASAVHLGLVARLVSPALGAAVLGHRVDLRPGGLWWQDTAGGPVPLSVPAPAGGTGIPGEWDRPLLDEAVAPLTAAVARLVPVPGRVLWGNVASAANAAAAQVARQRPDLAGDAWRAAGRLLASPWLRDEPHPPGPAFRRSSCCLFYRLAPGDPSAVCGDCVLTGRQANDERLSRTTSCSACRPPLPAGAWRAARAVSSPSGCAFGVVIAAGRRPAHADGDRFAVSSAAAGAAACGPAHSSGTRFAVPGCDATAAASAATIPGGTVGDGGADGHLALVGGRCCGPRRRRIGPRGSHPVPR